MAAPSSTFLNLSIYATTSSGSIPINCAAGQNRYQRPLLMAERRKGEGARKGEKEERRIKKKMQQWASRNNEKITKNQSLGINKPLLASSMSSLAEGWGLLVPIPTFCAKDDCVIKNPR